MLTLTLAAEATVDAGAMPAWGIALISIVVTGLVVIGHSIFVGALTGKPKRQEDQEQLQDRHTHEARQHFPVTKSTT